MYAGRPMWWRTCPKTTISIMTPVSAAQVVTKGQDFCIKLRHLLAFPTDRQSTSTGSGASLTLNTFVPRNKSFSLNFLICSWTPPVLTRFRAAQSFLRVLLVLEGHVDRGRRFPPLPTILLYHGELGVLLEVSFIFPII